MSRARLTPTLAARRAPRFMDRGTDRGDATVASEKASNLAMEQRQQVAIQEALGDSGRSALRKYQDLVVGSRSLLRLLLYELVITLTSWVPGALGLVLRRLGYRLLLASVGRNVIFGQGVVLRHPWKIRIGDHVTIDDQVVLDAKGTANRGITLGQGVFLGRGTILSCKDGDITLGDHVNIGFHSEICSGSSVTVGRHGLFAAYTYLVGGGHGGHVGPAPGRGRGRNPGPRGAEQNAGRRSPPLTWGGIGWGVDEEGAGKDLHHHLGPAHR